MILPFCSTLVRPHMECAGLPSTSMAILEEIQGMAMEMLNGLEHFSYAESLRELGLFILEDRRPGEEIGGILSMCISS